MANLGPTKLQAVNEILACANTARVSALNSSGTWPALTYGPSDEGNAEHVFDNCSRRFQEIGLRFNTQANVQTVLATSGSITLPSNTLRFIPTGISDNLELDIVQDKVYDLRRQTNTLLAGTYQYTLILLYDWIDIPPAEKDAIIKLASVEYQRRYRGSQLLDAQLQSEFNGSLPQVQFPRTFHSGEPLSRADQRAARLVAPYAQQTGGN